MLSKKLFGLVSAVLAFGMLAGCGNNAAGSEGSESRPDTSTSESQSSSSSQGSTVTHTVTFYDGGRVYGDPVTVNDGSPVAKPATDPTKESDDFADYTFDNWYLAGATEAYNFATPVTEDLDLYSKYTKSTRQYDLVVFVYGVNGASTPVTYITTAESDRVLNVFKALDGVDANMKILWHYVEGLTNINFNKYVNESVIPVDLVISGNKLDNDTDSIACDATYGKVTVGSGWFTAYTDAARRVAVTAACVDSHKAMAIKLYELLRNVGPEYEITLSDSALTLEIGDTHEIVATYYGAAPTFALQDVDPAGCVTLEGSTVTAVAAGTAKVVATDAAGHTAECAVTVSAAPVVPTHDLVIVINISNASNSWMTEADAQSLVNRFTSTGQPGEGKDVELHIVSGVAIAGVVSAINDIKAADNLGKVDAALCRKAFFTNAACPDILDGYTLKDVHSTWKYETGQYGVFADAFESHVALATAFGEFVAAQNVDYFDWAQATLTVKVDATYQIETELTGLTYSSLNEDIATVSTSGLITAIAEGSTHIRIRKQAYYFDMALTVEPLVVQSVTLHFYVCVSASSTTYMTDDNVTLLENHVNSNVPSTTTVEWHIVTGKTNANLAKLINGLTEDKADLVIGGSGAFGTEGDTIAVHSDMAKFKINDAFTKEKTDGTHEARYMAGVSGMDASHVTAALQVYNLVKNYSAA